MKTESYISARYLPFGDAALVVEFGDVIGLEINSKVIALGKAIHGAEIKGVEELIPTYRSLLVRYNPLKISYELLVFQIRDVEKTLKEATTKVKSRKIIIPVVYGGKYGPDLAYVAQFHGLSGEQVIELHSKRDYRVYMIGFVAGFPYLGEVSEEIATPRLETPRLKVPAGSIGIAEKQTGIYPYEAPGGWQIIGRTPIKLFNPLQQPPTLLKSGDAVRFKQISEQQFKITEEAVMKGAYQPFFKGHDSK
jgi:KipI family sensor histidine kinase inhibitor